MGAGIEAMSATALSFLVVLGLGAGLAAGWLAGTLSARSSGDRSRRRFWAVGLGAALALPFGTAALGAAMLAIGGIWAVVLVAGLSVAVLIGIALLTKG